MSKDCRANVTSRVTEPNGRLSQSNEVRQLGSFSAWVENLTCTILTSMSLKGTADLVGPKTLAAVHMMYKEITALLDTGSEISIIRTSVQEGT